MLNGEHIGPTAASRRALCQKQLFRQNANFGMHGISKLILLSVAPGDTMRNLKLGYRLERRKHGKHCALRYMVFVPVRR
ncbi:hypothetical protein [Desulfovibrio sp.]|uniref:hypothetical protein n=1 Tax=Desulfovibrio sp. TaxID=885 RepID=UPI0039E59D21